MNVLPTCVLLMDLTMAVLVEDLGHPQFERREAASQRLRLLGPLAMPALQQARGHADLEVARRAGQLYDEYWITYAERRASAVRPSSYPVLPWIDQLPPEHPERREVITFYLQLAHQNMRQERGPEWLDYREATRLYIRDLFRQQKGRVEVIQLLDRMADEEQAWIRRNRTTAAVIPASH
jgi:hypothetical protein